MEKVGIKINELNLGLEKISRNFTELKESNRKLLEDISNLKNNLKYKDEKISELENKIKMLKIADNLSSDKQDKTEMKQRINVFVKEIDKCIAMLNS